MQSKPSVIAQRLLNLYRAQHVIFGGWDALNRVFIAEGDAEVLKQLQSMPAGRLLAMHIDNLRTGKTPMNSIAPELLPYGGSMRDTAPSTNLSTSEISELEQALNEFTPDSDGLARIQSLDVVQKFGDEWLIAVRSALADKPKMLAAWNNVSKTARAYYLWKVANDILAAPLSDRARARVQADLPEFETYLPMFGDTGREVLSKLRIFVSSL